MIKIASLVPYKILPPISGGEKGVYYFLHYLGRYAAINCFTVFENKTSGKENFTTIPVLGSTKNKWRYVNPFLIFTLKKELKQRGIKYLMIEHPYYGWLGVLLKKIMGIQLIIHSHNIESLRFRDFGKLWWRILYGYEKFTHRQADINFFITPEDKKFAIERFRLDADKCHVITYGIEAPEAPISEKGIAKAQICKALSLDINTTLILFNGELAYTPNLKAVDHILTQINPLLLQKTARSYKIIFCGRGLPDAYNQLQEYKNRNIIYTGFVKDIQQYFLAADIFINPITIGGGIKTKLVEALASNTSCISFRSGAYGIPITLTGNNLMVVEDYNYEAFANAIADVMSRLKENIPPAFYEYFNWDKIAQRVIDKIEKLAP